MRNLILAYLLFFGISANAQSSWNTATRVGYNRIGLGIDQTVGDSFGNRKEHTIALGAKWYWFDVVFAKETVGLTFDYRYNFRADEMPMQFSLGFNCNGYRERLEVFKSRITELNFYNRGTFIKPNRFQPFYEIGVGGVFHSTGTLGPPAESFYFNYSISVGLNINF